MGRVSHNDSPTFGVIFVDTKFHHVVFAFDVKLFVNFVFNRKSMGVPAKSPLDVKAS